MRKFTLLLLLLLLVGGSQVATAEKVVMTKYGTFDHWITRVIKESAVIGGATKKVYEIGPAQTINGDRAYSNLGGSPWATSNVMAKVMGVTKTSNAVFPDTHNGGHCAKLTTIMEHVKAAGIINMDVLVTGTIFMGQMLEPVKSTKNPYSKMTMGVPYNQRPRFLQFDYRLVNPGGNAIYSSGFGSKKTLNQKDYAEVFIILQRRWEDSKGNLHAQRVGTGRERFARTTNGWVNRHRIPVWYGDIRHHAGYKSFMGLIPREKSYYARNSKGKVVPVVEEGWAAAGATPTHVLVMASSGCGTAYVGTPGMTLWIDNVAFVE